MQRAADADAGLAPQAIKNAPPKGRGRGLLKPISVRSSAHPALPPMSPLLRRSLSPHRPCRSLLHPCRHRCSVLGTYGRTPWGHLQERSRTGSCFPSSNTSRNTPSLIGRFLTLFSLLSSNSWLRPLPNHDLIVPLLNGANLSLLWITPERSATFSSNDRNKLQHCSQKKTPGTRDRAGRLLSDGTPLSLFSQQPFPLRYYKQRRRSRRKVKLY